MGVPIIRPVIFRRGHYKKYLKHKMKRNHPLKYIFISGGQGSGGALFSTVYSAQIKSDGTIGSWATLSTLPEVKYYHSMAAYNGYLYVTGGVSQTTVLI